MLNTEEILTDEEAKRIIMALYDRGYGLAVYMIERILGTKLALEVRDDLVQEGFLKMVIHVEQLHQRSPQEQLAYLARTMRTVALEEARRRTQRRLLDSLDDLNCPEPESSDLTPEEFCMMQEDISEKRANMRAALERLPERDRRLLVEKYQNGRSDAEIGMMLDIKTRNVRVYLARARRKAAIYYGEEIDGKREEKHRKDAGTEEQIVQETKSEGV
ncbi:MAG: sigma-70 family RNA polymerase sigma factor [Lachnospiraceae bacterium]|nr:sigma-70 family RNA polymerase sigma factor [Lachnospiraceae bacterium]